MTSKIVNSAHLTLAILTIIQIFEYHQAQGEFSSITKSCISIFNTAGSCVNIEKCHSILELISRNPYLGRQVMIGSLCSIKQNNFIVCCPGLEGDDKDDQDNTNTGTIDNSKEISTVKPLSPPQCGYSNSPHDRVVGGNPSALGAWPWIASIGYGNLGSQYVTFRCGGTLISSHHVVTAAHCVHGLEDELRLVRLGEHDFNNLNDGAKPIDVNVKKAIVHPDFDAETMENDIAILKLDRDIEFTDLIHPICLPTTEDLENRSFVGNYPFVAGWGSTYYGGPTSSILRETQIPVISNTKCEQVYRHTQNVVVDNRILCAGYSQGGKDACQGDSGGPLMYPQKTTYYLIGVVSGGYKCAEPGIPGIYTRVTSFLNFILSNMD